MTDVLDKHSRMPRRVGEPQGRDDETGRYLPADPALRAAVLADVRPALEAGQTLAQIAQRHGIAPRTLDYWLAQLPDGERAEITRTWVDAKLTDCEARITAAPDPLELARARELTRLAQWRAERRDPKRYADRREITVHQDEPTDPDAIRARIALLERRLGIRVIDAIDAPSSVSST